MVRIACHFRPLKLFARSNALKEERRGPKRSVSGYSISAVAESYDVHPQTLRLYERAGLLNPFRSAGNTRYYSDSDLERLEMILTLTRDMGVNLAGVDVIIHLRERLERMQEEMTQVLEALRGEIAVRVADASGPKPEALVVQAHGRPPIGGGLRGRRPAGGS